MRHAVSAFLMCWLLPAVSHADWVADGLPVSTTSASAFSSLSAISDGEGGAIVVWINSGVVYAQKVDVDGGSVWTPGGIAVSAAGSTFASATSDGNGGAIVCWAGPGPLGADIHTQRISTAGVVEWTGGGVPISGIGDQTTPSIVPDGSGGAIVLFSRSGTGDIWGQRVNSSGAVQWGGGGVDLGTATTAFLFGLLQVVPDGAGGVIVAWSDTRAGLGFANIYAQRVNSAGSTQWTTDGVLLCGAAGIQVTGGVVSDGAGGAIVSWQDPRFGASDIYAQRVTDLGTPSWAADGIPICAFGAGQTFPVATSDNSGGAIIAWTDPRADAGDIYAQRVNPAGITLWALDGVALCAAVGVQSSVQLVADGVGGAIGAWLDDRSGITDVYAQRMDPTGAPIWAVDGVAACTAVGAQSAAWIAPDAASGAYVTWIDPRAGIGSTVYAQRLTSLTGMWGTPEPVITEVADVQADQGGRVKVNWEASDWDKLGIEIITHYSIWRAVDMFPATAAIVESPGKVRLDHHQRVIWIEHAATADYYWEWLGNQVIINSPGYSYSAATRSDSTIAGSADHFFQVVAHAASPFLFWRSNVMVGHSVDNLAPLAPLNFTAERVSSAASGGSGAHAAAAIGDVLCTWQHSTEGDLHDYSLYRSASANVTATPEFFLASTSDDSYLDTTAPMEQSFYYILTANDVHGNSSSATVAIAVGPSTGTGASPPLSALTVLQNRPNPFAAFTEWQIGLPTASTVEINVYDVAGKVVRKMSFLDGRAGWRSVTFDGHNDAGEVLASGVYFYRVSAAGRTITRKMVIAR